MSVPADRIGALQRAAFIRRETARAQRDLITLLKSVDRDLISIFERALDAITRELRAAGDGGGTIRLQVLDGLRNQITGRLAEMREQLDGRLEAGLVEGAALGSRPFVSELGAGVLAAADEAGVRFVKQFMGDPGRVGRLLSDRVWIQNQSARRIIIEAVENAVIQGQSSIQAAEELLARGQPVPAAISRAQQAAQVDRIDGTIRRAVLRDTTSPLRHFKRLFRTEIARARIISYRESAFEHPDVIGVRFKLSPRHPRKDICDMHASVNRYGLGPGVYPRNRSPLPAHPETLSFEEVVFSDEISDADRSGKEDRISWLKRQSADLQTAVVGGVQKRNALLRDELKENQIATPWRVISRRISR